MELKKETFESLYEALRKIQFYNRIEYVKQTFDLNKEYIIEGDLGTVTVIFNESDMV